jgi:hypothetical protein
MIVRRGLTTSHLARPKSRSQHRSRCVRRRGRPVGLKLPAGQAIAFPLQEYQEAIMTIQFPRKGVAASRLLKSGSSLVRRVVQAQDDPAKQRIRAWLTALENEQLSGSLGLTPEDIAILRPERRDDEPAVLRGAVRLRAQAAGCSSGGGGVTRGQDRSLDEVAGLRCRRALRRSWHTASETRALSLRQLNFASAPQDGAKTARTRIASCANV